MISKMVSYAVLYINTLSAKSSLSNTLAPRTIMTSTTLDYNNHCGLNFGEYSDTHKESDHSNSMKAHTESSICLFLQGTYRVPIYLLTLALGVDSNTIFQTTAHANSYYWLGVPVGWSSSSDPCSLICFVGMGYPSSMPTIVLTQTSHPMIPWTISSAMDSQERTSCTKLQEWMRMRSQKTTTHLLSHRTLAHTTTKQT